MTEISVVALLDDYQDAGRTSADWSRLPHAVEVRSLREPLAGEALITALEDVDVVVAMRERTAFTAQVFERLPRLRLLVTTGPANAAIDLEAASRGGVVVSGTGAGGIRPTIELTWGLILAVARQIPGEAGSVQGGGWQTSLGADLHGRRLGVVGLGGVGAEVARIGAAFGMEVVAWSPHLDPDAARAHGVRAVSRDELFADSDVITVHMKLSDSTEGLIGAREIGLMRDTAILINTSRGPIVDERALLSALASGAIRGAGVDVYDVEPLPVDSPWRSAPRAVLTPHLGFVTADTYHAWYGEAVEDIAAFIADAPIRVLNP